MPLPINFCMVLSILLPLTTAVFASIVLGSLNTAESDNEAGPNLTVLSSLKDRLGSYRTDLLTNISWLADDVPSSFAAFHRSSLYSGYWDDMEMAKIQINMFNIDLTLGMCLDSAHHVIFQGSNYPQLCHDFIHGIIFPLGSWYVNTRIRQNSHSRLKKTNANAGLFSRLGPSLFSSGLIREAFTCCAYLLDPEHIAMLLDKNECYFPLIVSNFDAAVQFKEWPIIAVDDLDRIFENFLPSLYEYAYDIPDADKKISSFSDNYTKVFFEKIANGNLALPAWKLPNFLKNCPNNVLLKLIRSMNFDLLMPELDALIEANCIGRLTDYLSQDRDVCVTMSFGYCMAGQCLFPNPTAGAGSGYNATTSLGVFFDNKKFFSQLEVVNDKLRSRDFYIAVIQFVVYSELIITNIVNGLRMTKRSIAHICFFEHLCRVFNGRIALKKSFGKNTFLNRRMRSINWNILLSTPLSQRIRSALPFNSMPRTKNIKNLEFSAVLRQFDDIYPGILAAVYDSSLISTPSAGTELAAAFSCWSRKFNIHLRPVNIYFYVLILNDELWERILESPATYQDPADYFQVIKSGRSASLIDPNLEEDFRNYLLLMQEAMVELIADYVFLQTSSLDLLDLTHECFPLIPGFIGINHFRQLYHTVLFYHGLRMLHNAECCTSTQLHQSTFNGIITVTASKLLDADRLYKALNLNFGAGLLEGLGFVFSVHGLRLGGPLLSSDIVCLLTKVFNSTNWIKIISFPLFFLNLKSLSGLDSAMIDSLNMPLDQGKFFLYSCTSEMLTDYLDKVEGITDNPIHFIFSINYCLWFDTFFQRSAWSQFVLPVFLLSDTFRTHTEFLELVTRTWLENAFAITEFNSANLRRLIWALIRYSIFMDYNYRLLCVWIKFVKGPLCLEALQFYRDRWLVEEVKARIKFENMLNAFFNVLEIQNLDHSASAVVNDLIALVRTHRWSKLVSSERLVHHNLLKKKAGSNLCPEIANFDFYTTTDSPFIEALLLIYAPTEKSRDFWKFRYYATRSSQLLHKNALWNNRYISEGIAPIFDIWVSHATVS